MKKGEKIIYLILAGIPILFILFLLAMLSPVLPLLGIAVILTGLLLLKKRKPEWFSKRPADRGGSKDKQKETKIKPAPRPANNVFVVLVDQGSGTGDRISVSKTPFYIGRSDESDFVLKGGRVSRHHLLIEYDRQENACYATDQSANGTFLNNERMLSGQRTRLHQGDYLMIDGRRLSVEYANYAPGEEKKEK